MHWLQCLKLSVSEQIVFKMSVYLVENPHPKTEIAQFLLSKYNMT